MPLAALAFATLAQATDITGAGATFPYPIYAKWAEAYKAKTGIGMNYQSIGSGGGMRNRSRAANALASDGWVTDRPSRRICAGCRGRGPISPSERKERDAGPG